MSLVHVMLLNGSRFKGIGRASQRGIRNLAGIQQKLEAKATFVAS